MADAQPGNPLALRRRSRRLVGLVWLVGLGLVAAVVGYVTTHPDELRVDEALVSGSTPAGTPVYLGVFATRSDFGRELEISGVKVYATSSVPVTITPHLCRDGSLNVTTDPALFCSEVVPTEGATMAAGDEIVLEVVGEGGGVVSVDRIRVAYRDGFQWATQRAGSPAVVTILSR